MLKFNNNSGALIKLSSYVSIIIFALDSILNIKKAALRAALDFLR